MVVHGQRLIIISDMEIHVFCDAAAEKDYGACVYLRIPSGENRYETSLAISRARVAPVHEVTVPRLELLATLLGARLLSFVHQALGLDHKIINERTFKTSRWNLKN